MYGSWEKPRRKTRILPKTGTFYLLSFAFYLPLIKTAVSQPVLKFYVKSWLLRNRDVHIDEFSPEFDRKDTIENIETPKSLKNLFFVKKKC